MEDIQSESQVIRLNATDEDQHVVTYSVISGNEVREKLSSGSCFKSSAPQYNAVSFVLHLSHQIYFSFHFLLAWRVFS